MARAEGVRSSCRTLRRWDDAPSCGPEANAACGAAAVEAADGDMAWGVIEVKDFAATRAAEGTVNRCTPDADCLLKSR